MAKTDLRPVNLNLFACGGNAKLRLQPIEKQYYEFKITLPEPILPHVQVPLKGSFKPEPTIKAQKPKFPIFQNFKSPQQNITPIPKELICEALLSEKRTKFPHVRTLSWKLKTRPPGVVKGQSWKSAHYIAHYIALGRKRTNSDFTLLTPSILLQVLDDHPSQASTTEDSMCQDAHTQYRLQQYHQNIFDIQKSHLATSDIDKYRDSDIYKESLLVFNPLGENGLTTGSVITQQMMNDMNDDEINISAVNGIRNHRITSKNEPETCRLREQEQPAPPENITSNCESTDSEDFKKKMSTELHELNTERETSRNKSFQEELHLVELGAKTSCEEAIVQENVTEVTHMKSATEEEVLLMTTNDTGAVLANDSEAGGKLDNYTQPEQTGSDPCWTMDEVSQENTNNSRRSAESKMKQITNTDAQQKFTKRVNTNRNCTTYSENPIKWQTSMKPTKKRTITKRVDKKDWQTTTNEETLTCEESQVNESHRPTAKTNSSQNVDLNKLPNAMRNKTMLNNDVENRGKKLYELRQSHTWRLPKIAARTARCQQEWHRGETGSEHSSRLAVRLQWEMEKLSVLAKTATAVYPDINEYDNGRDSSN